MQAPTITAAGSSPLESLPAQYGYQLYACLIIFALVLLVYGFVSRGDAAVRRRLGTLGAALLFLMIAVFFQTKVDAQRGFIADQEKRYDEMLKKVSKEKGKEAALKMQYMYMPSAESLKIMTLYNPSLAADYVWLTSLQYVSNSFRRGEKFDMLIRFYQTMVDLDPHWIDAEINGGKVLSALIEEREKSEKECYKYAIDQNLSHPQVWKLRYEAGLLYVMPPNDPRKLSEFSQKSAMYFDQALVSPNFPKNMVSVVSDRIARLRLESGSSFYREAEEMMARNATASDTPGPLQEISRRDWLKAHSMALAAALADAAAAYKKEKGEFPPSLDIVIKGFARPEAFATDAYGFPFDYDAKSGEVTSRGAKALHAIQAGHVVNELNTLFRSIHNRSPKDLIELRDFVRTCKESPLYPPSVMVIEAIGDARAIAADKSVGKADAQKHLDPTVGPLGPWKYDAAKGEIEFPPECDINKLYGHINDYDWKPTGITRKH